MQLHDVLDAFATSNVEMAIDVWTRDRDVDRLCTSLFRDLLGRMMENTIKISLGTHLLFCTKNFERMGDHATNIAEAVHYMVVGETLPRERPKADLTSMLSVIRVGNSIANMSAVQPAEDSQSTRLSHWNQRSSVDDR